MLIRCPSCLCKSRIAASEQLSNETRRTYNQCLNFNCGVTFTQLTSLEKIIRSPSQGSHPPDSTKQPELCLNPNQMDLLVGEPMPCIG
ncbi:ogr/Delta-like zinc finger family protein [Psychromonas hadalis]|uniref:ogr/Delta-like zinc finger family protein n=1 Tax=Psychromonas hadalis TaxID=211669 RepID=UPI0003B38BA7